MSLMAREAEERSEAGGGLFYGWVVVAATFVVLLVGFGTAYSFASFFHSLRDEFHATRSEVSLVFAITGALYFSLGAVSGPLADRVGPQRVIAAGIGLIAVGLLLASRAQALWQVYVTYSLGVGVGVGFVYVPAVGAVQRWFVRRRGFASGLAVTGIGAGTLAAPLLAAWLIDLAGWRSTYVVLALVTLVLGLMAAALIEHSPQGRGLAPDGVPPDGPGHDGQAATGTASLAAQQSWTMRAAFRSRPFALLYAATTATALGLFIPFVHLAPYARDHGYSDLTGAWLVGLIGVGSTLGRLVLGGSADQMGRRPSLVAAFAGMAVMLALWMVSTNVWALGCFAIVFGVCYGGFVALLPALTTDYFGPRNAGGIIGVLYSAAGIGALAGPSLAGLVYDLRGSYVLPIAFGAVANLVAVACMLAIADPAHWRAQTAELTGSGGDGA